MLHVEAVGAAEGGRVVGGVHEAQAVVGAAVDGGAQPVGDIPADEAALAEEVPKDPRIHPGVPADLGDAATFALEVLAERLEELSLGREARSPRLNAEVRDAGDQDHGVELRAGEQPRRVRQVGGAESRPDAMMNRPVLGERLNSMPVELTP